VVGEEVWDGVVDSGVVLAVAAEVEARREGRCSLLATACARREAGPEMMRYRWRA
jgi:hypothetical protein